MFLTKLRWVLAAVVVAMGVTNGWSQTPKPDLKSTPGLSDAFARAVRGFDKTPRGSYFASQPSQGYQAELSAKGGLTLSTGKTRFGVSVTAYGRGSVRGQLGETTAKVGNDSAGWPQLSFDRPQLSEWYVNEQSGLHHWLRVEKRPAAAGSLWVRLGVTGDVKLKSVSDTAVEVHGQSTVLTYGGLKVWDAKGKVLPARLEVAQQNIHVVVDDAAAVYPVVIDPDWIQTQKLTALDKASGDLFGTAVSVDGNYAVIGAPGPSSNSTIPGAAYVFFRSGVTWSQQQKLTASDGIVGNEFGGSVSISGDTVVVGSSFNAPESVSGAGAAYVFVRGGNTWTEQQKLSATDKQAYHRFGSAVSVSGNYAVIGAPFANGSQSSDAGAAYIFERNGSTWTQQQKLLASDSSSNARFGFSVSVFGNSAIVGSTRSNIGALGEAGAAYVFVRSGSSWTQEQKLFVSDGGHGDEFGSAVAGFADTAIIGASLHLHGHPTNFEAGAAYVFRRTGGIWALEQKLLPPGLKSGDQFGSCVSLSGNTAVVGSQTSPNDISRAGAAYIFLRSGSVWSQQKKLVATDQAAFDFLGSSVSISGDTALVGAFRSSPDSVTKAGAVYEFRLADQLSIAFNTGTVASGDGAAGTITLESPAPAGGIVVSLSSNSSSLTMPITVTVPAGSNSIGFTATAGNVLADTTAVVTASAPGQTTSTAAITIQPRAENSDFVSQSVQSTYYATNQHAVSVTMRNMGTTTWTRTTHRLVSMNPFNNSVWGRTDVLIPTGVSIAPGQSHTFAFNITAPTTAGTYNFQWQMRKVSPGLPANFGQTSTNVLVSVLTGFNAEFFSQSVPTALEPGKKVDVQVVMRNRGSTTWTPDNVRLISKTTPTNLFGKDSIQLLPGETIAPGQYKTFNFRIQAPAAEGDYAFKWQMRRLGVANFGPETPTVSIHIQALYNSQFVSQSVPSTMQTANSYPVSVTFTNTGTATWAPGQYILYSQNAPGNNRWRVNSVPLPSSVAPGASVTFNFTVYAPLTPGSYNFQWRLRKSGTGDFGALSTNVPVVVNN